MRFLILLATLIDLAVSSDCYVTNLEICKKRGPRMPQFPCISENKQKERKKKKVCKKKLLKKKCKTKALKGPATHIETVKFLNKKKRYLSMDRKNGKADVCCSKKRLFRNLNALYKSDFYNEAEDYQETCQSLLDENQDDKSTALPKKLLKKKNIKLFMSMCVWLQLQEDDEEVSHFC